MQVSFKVKFLFVLILCTPVLVMSQTAKNYAVMLERSGTGTPVTLTWDYDSNATAYSVYRRASGSAVAWGAALAVKQPGDTTYTDAGAADGTYEYYVLKNLKNGRIGHGYLLTGVQYADYTRIARILVVIDANYMLPLAADISQLIGDLAADGWFADTIVVKRTDAVSAVKQRIRNWYNLYSNTPIKPTALYLLGHIPVPYSGDIFPDGHRPDHRGAWPADVYYGVMNEDGWTDANVDVDSAAHARNHNLPGDGKFDRDYIYPDTSSLEIGRVDLTDMPAFGQSDTMLVKKYLEKAHAFKLKMFTPSRQAVVDDHFGETGGEAFAASGWRGFSTMVGRQNVRQGEYLSIKQQSHLLSYGCGGGNYTSASGVANTNHFVSDSIYTVFNVLFGSYFGDWDNTNNFLRAPLCSQPMSLVSIWSGRPHWNLHHMSMGLSIGHCARLAQNNIDGRLLIPPVFEGYVSSNFPTYIHVALMGDPTVRLFYNPSPQQVVKAGNNDSSQYTFSWEGNPGAIGYEIYRSLNPMHAGTIIGATTDTFFTTDNIFPGLNHVHVRAVYMDTSSSGIFKQRSLGAYISVSGGVNATGLKMPSRNEMNIVLYPNPASGSFTISGEFNKAEMEIYTVTGQLVVKKEIQGGETMTSALNPGVYFVKLNSGSASGYKKLIIR